jgi:hypothetical protein
MSIRTCFPTHHLQFGFDANQTLWTSAGGPGSGVVGWLDRKMFGVAGCRVLGSPKPDAQRGAAMHPWRSVVAG